MAEELERLRHLREQTTHYPYRLGLMEIVIGLVFIIGLPFSELLYNRGDYIFLGIGLLAVAGLVWWCQRRIRRWYVERTGYVRPREGPPSKAEWAFGIVLGLGVFILMQLHMIKFIAQWPGRLRDPPPWLVEPASRLPDWLALLRSFSLWQGFWLAWPFFSGVVMLSEGLHTRTRRWLYLGVYLMLVSFLLGAVPFFHSRLWSYAGLLTGLGFVVSGLSGHREYLGLIREG